MSNVAHVIDENKRTTRTPHRAWCGENVWSTDWAYQSSQHLKAAIERNDTPAEPCGGCVAAIEAR